MTRDRIIEAALRLFGTEGYTRTTTRAIAEAAGVNEVTIFRQFGSKKNLLMACVDAFNAAGVAATHEADLTGDYATDIAAMARRAVQETASAFDLLRLMLCEASAVPELIEAARHGSGGNTARMTAYFQRQIDAGTVRADLNAEALAFTFDSLFSTALIVPVMLSGEGIPDPTIQQMADVFVAGTAVKS